MPGIARLGALLLTVLTLTLIAACGTNEDTATPTPSGAGSEPTTTADPEPTATESEEQAALDGTAWLLEGMNGVEMDLQEPITLAFDEGRVSGFAGCNDYGGAYIADPDGSFSIPEIEQTDMACESGMDLEAEYLSTLANVARYEVIEDSRLELANTAGETVLIFTSDARLPLDATSWSVTELNGEPVIDATDIHFTLRAGEISGSGGCNQFGGRYAADESGAFSASELFWTEMGCIEPEGAMEQEQAFFETLAAVTTYQHDADAGTLTLLDAEGQPRIVAVTRDEQAGASIFGSPGWVLARLGNQELDDDTLITIRFDASQFSGTAVCSGYSGVFESDPEGVISRTTMTPDEITCHTAGESALANEYLTAFAAAKQYRISGGMLDMLDASGEVLFSYRPAIADHDLEGTYWELTTLRGDENIPGTLVTAEFSDGYLLGSGGCNEYGSPYIVPERGVIIIPQAVMTAMGCPEPPGIEEQERAFHDALQDVRGYEVGEDSLELLDSDGQVLMTFERTR
jgi:heat shock protein HslJ